VEDWLEPAEYVCRGFSMPSVLSIRSVTAFNAAFEGGRSRTRLWYGTDFLKVVWKERVQWLALWNSPEVESRGKMVICC